MELPGLLFLLIALVLSLTLHEFAHAWMSHYLGDDTASTRGRLTLNPLSHIDPVMTVLLPAVLILSHSPVVFGAARPVPFNPWAVRYGKWGAALVAAAGPAMNLLLAIFFALWLRFVPIGDVATQLFISIITVNLAFMVFNLIPIPPLDGSRILYAAAPPGLRDAMDNLERSGLLIIFVLLFLAGPILMPLLATIIGAIEQVLIPGLTGLST